MTKIGVGIIGTGGIAGTAHVPAINAIPETTLTAVLSRDKTNGQDFLDQHNQPDASVYSSINDFVDDSNIQLVIICTPDVLHFEQAKVCLEAGKHVLLEKPMALNDDQAKELINLAHTKNLKLAIGFHHRSHQGHIELQKRIEQGEIGKLRHIRAIWAFSTYDDSNWRAI